MPLSMFLWKNGVVSTPFGQRFLVTGRPATNGIITGRDFGEVADHVRLGGAGLRIQHLRKIGQRKAVAVHLHLCVVPGHASRS